MHAVTLLVLASALVSPAAHAAQDIYATDFTTLDGWTVQAADSPCAAAYAWAADATPAWIPGSQANCAAGTAPFTSPPASLNFNDGVDIGGAVGHGFGYYTCGSVLSPPIDLASATSPTATLSFWLTVDMETTCQWDELRLIIRPAGGGADFYNECFELDGAFACDWREFHLPLDISWGMIEIEFSFDTIDNWLNAGAGPFIDDLRVVDGTPCVSPTNYCDAIPNSTGVAANISNNGTPSLSANDFELQVDNCPPNQSGMFFYGEAQNSLFYGDGRLCIAPGSIGFIRIRPVVQTDAQGTVNLLIDSTAPVHSSGPGLLEAGSTRYFQFWHRDPFGGSAGFNYSDGLEVIFCP